MRKSHLLIAGLFILAIILIVRLLWVASHAETGWSLLKRQWLDATVGLFKGEQIPIYRQEPTDQADFWLKEVKRITDADPENAELAMGAAILLDSPASGFLYRYSINSQQSGVAGATLQIDWNSANKASDCFESRCKDLCLTMAARATELQPDDARWWRLRALLLISGNSYGSRNQVRDPDWVSVLDQYIKHDPDNAFFDYLAAWQLWHESMVYDYTSKNVNVKIIDPLKYDQALRYFKSGQKKSHCVLVDDISSVLNSFLQRSTISGLDLPGVIVNREIKNKIVFVLVDLWRRLNMQAEEAEQNCDALSSLILSREQLRMLEQFHESKGISNYENFIASLLANTLNKIQNLAEDNPELISQEEFAKIEAASEKASFEGKLFAEASKRIADRQNKPYDYGFIILISLLVNIAQLTVLLLSTAGICAWILGRFINWKNERPSGIMGCFRNLFVWIGGYVLTFLILGLTAAGIISLEMQTQVGSFLLLLFGCFLINLLFWRAIYRRKIPYVIKTIMVLTLVLAVCVGILELFNFQLLDQRKLHSIVNIPSDPWYGNVELFMNAIASKVGIFYWALLQWLYCAGLYLSITFSLALLASWYHLRFARKTAGTALGWRSRWGGMFQSLGWSMIFAAFIWLFIYLSFMPSLIQSFEDQHQYTMSFVRNPGKYAELMEKTVEEVKKDWSWMNEQQPQEQELQ